MPDPTPSTLDPDHDVSTVGTSNVYFQAWVPFQSGTLSKTGAFGATYTDTGYQAAYGLLSPYAPQPMGSFLHMGAIDADMTNPSTIADPQKKATYTTALNLENMITAYTDDTRIRNEQPNPSTPVLGSATPSGARQQESALLHLKGGWRDHTDGNRITTTAGDKIEVIGGNSVTLILGRPTTDNVFSATDWSNPTSGAPQNHIEESSGWLGYKNDGGPGHIEEIRWVADKYGNQGTWMVREKTYMGDAIAIGSGSSWESFVGASAELGSGDTISYHGRLSDIPNALINNNNFNPSDVYRDEQSQGPTFPYWNDGTVESRLLSVKKNAAATFNSGTAAPGIPPTLNEQSQNVIEYARLDSAFGDTIVTGNVSETTTIGGSESTTSTVSGDSTDNTTVVGSRSERTTLSSLSGVTTISSNRSDVEAIGGNSASITSVGGAIEEITAWGGTSVGIDAGATKLEFSGHVARASLELTAESVDLFIGVARQEIALCPYAYEYGGDKIMFSDKGTLGAAVELSITSLIVNITGTVNIGGPPVELPALEAARLLLVANAAP